MASEVDICNLGLSHLGDDAEISSITPPDGSVQAMHCKRFYPMARDALLEMHNWGFAMRRANLALIDTDETPADWAFAYQYPNCHRVVAVFPPQTTSSSSERLIFDQTEFLSKPKSNPFVVESLSDGSVVIYTNVEDATVLYVAKITDTVKFSALFVIALARLLASYLAGPILKGKTGMEVAKEQLGLFEKIEGMRAKVSDSQNGKSADYNEFTPSSLAARR